MRYIALNFAGSAGTLRAIHGYAGAIHKQHGQLSKEILERMEGGERGPTMRSYVIHSPLPEGFDPLPLEVTRDWDARVWLMALKHGLANEDRALESAQVGTFLRETEPSYREFTLARNERNRVKRPKKQAKTIM